MKLAFIFSVLSYISKSWPASNLLSKTAKKWRCKTAGEKKAYVCFQLDRPAQITGIDIGNEYSAHVTVQVGRKGARDEDFQVDVDPMILFAMSLFYYNMKTYKKKLQEILLATTLMSTAECRNATNFNRVRCFHKDALIESVAASRWELVKIICTQPYSNQYAFGLSMVKIHAAPDATDTKVDKPLLPVSFIANAAAQTSSASPFAKFKLRADSSESDSETGSQLFSRWKEAKQQSTTASTANTSTAAAIRDSSATPASLLKQAASHKPRFSTVTTTTKKVPTTEEDADETSNETAPKHKDRNRRAILYESDDDKPNERLDKKLNHDRRLEEKQLDEKARKATDLASTSNVAQRSRTSERSSDKFRDFLDDDDIGKRKVTTTTKTPTRTDPKCNMLPTVSRKRTLSPGAAVPSTSTVAETPQKKNKVDSKGIVAGPAQKQRSFKPFKRLLEGVVLVISGIQNPERGHIRDKALKMGAKYKTDWDRNCTHLM